MGGPLLPLLGWIVALSGPVQDAGDGWDMTVDASTRLTMASVTYASGQSLAVRCRAGELDVVVGGLTPDGGKSRYVEAALGDRPADMQNWFNIADGAVVFSGTPAFHARSLRHGGEMRFGVGPSGLNPQVTRRYVMDLPDQSDGIDQVLTACGAPLADPRDDLPRYNTLVLPEGESPWARLPRPEFPQAAQSAGVMTGFAVASCIVGAGGRPLDCRVEKESDPRAGFGNAMLNALGSARLRMSGERAAAPGQVVVGLFRFELA